MEERLQIYYSGPIGNAIAEDIRRAGTHIELLQKFGEVTTENSYRSFDAARVKPEKLYASDVMAADFTRHSIGIGIEVALFAKTNKPTVVFRNKNEAKYPMVSRVELLEGFDFKLIEYSMKHELEKLTKDFFDEVERKRRIDTL